MFKLYLQLADHVKLMRLWAPDADWLWGKTHLPGSSHRWFELVSSLGTNLDASDIIVEDLEPTINEIKEQLQEEVFIDDANNGELAGDEEVQEMVGDANPDQPNN
ncbi:hypothetical protein PGT21_029638 [Puccinia graminis f. sp. tritici]|uniref:Uncharacterized protein n=2 Tax=Puccinia graminis f. sp. tritici TaxID=56615 RepID=H6QVJ0_PUCGT|nr:uncharacterized protein PGTG_22777 [Puccinia graminis f. sp. tritici CRL 75-36-700-3]EHS63118.1 hypothetical protein PGTG_22777 [Puccinia graminis f. sp. tritici CRL 75-36-700-3]KAA1075126.1 hypothetical protein PGT21_029638 [Puccinia graminis f. sp. tritici]